MHVGQQQLRCLGGLEPMGLSGSCTVVLRMSMAPKWWTWVSKKAVRHLNTCVDLPLTSLWMLINKDQMLVVDW